MFLISDNMEKVASEKTRNLVGGCGCGRGGAIKAPSRKLRADSLQAMGPGSSTGSAFNGESGDQGDQGDQEKRKELAEQAGGVHGSFPSALPELSFLPFILFSLSFSLFLSHSLSPFILS